MNSTLLEARLIGLRHQPGCPGDRVETFDASTPGPMIRGSARGPTRRGPPTPARVAHCLGCGESAMRVVGQREQLAAIAATIDQKEAEHDASRAAGG